jgi:hypothetical protein
VSHLKRERLNPARKILAGIALTRDDRAGMNTCRGRDGCSPKECIEKQNRKKKHGSKKTTASSEKQP